MLIKLIDYIICKLICVRQYLITSKIDLVRTTGHIATVNDSEELRKIQLKQLKEIAKLVLLFKGK